LDRSSAASRPGGWAERTGGGCLEGAAVLLLCLAGAWFLFDPVFSDLTNQAIVGKGPLKADTYLMLWVLSWGSRAIWLQPLSYFDANIHFPAASSLAGVEHMFGYLPLFAPPYYLTGNSVFAFQCTVWLSFALSGAAMYALVRHWGGTRSGAAFAAFVVMAAPGQFERAYVVQMIGWFYLPVALICFDRTLDRGRVLDAVLLAVALALQLLCSFYVAYITIAFFGSYVLTVVLWRGGFRRDLSWRNLATAAVAVSVAALCLLVFALPYVSRGAAGEMADHAARGILPFAKVPFWQSYALSSQRNAVFGPSYYLGVACLLLAPYALWRARAIGPLRVVGLWAAFATCAVLAAGPERIFAGVPLPPLYDLFLLLPGFSSVRGPNRFAMGVDVAAAALAGLALSDLIRRLRLPGWAATGVLAALIAASYFDYGHASFDHRALEVPVGSRVPEVYRRLAMLEPGVVLELPAGAKSSFLQIVRESRYAYFSTYHWNPILNGYTGHQPPSSSDVMVVAQALPDPRAVDLLGRMTGLTYIVVHFDQMPAASEALWRNPTGLERVGVFAGAGLFRVTQPPPADLTQELLAGVDTGKTFAGNAIAQVPASQQSATVQFWPSPPRSAVAAMPERVLVSVRNESAVVWPGLAPGEREVVRWVAQWSDPRTGEQSSELELSPLPFDLMPGAELLTAIDVPVPREHGVSRLQVGLRQGDGEWFSGRATASAVAIGGFRNLKRLNRERDAR